MITPPSILLPKFIKGEDVVVLQAFSRFKKGVDYKSILRQLFKMSDSMNVTIYLEHNKVYHTLSTDFYEGCGFDKTEYPNWYVRTPKY